MLKPKTKKKTPQSQYPGVTWDSARDTWRARGRNLEGKMLYLGNFRNEEDAALACDKVARHFFGKNARRVLPGRAPKPASPEEVRAWCSSLPVYEVSSEGPFRGAYVDPYNPWRYAARVRIPSEDRIVHCGYWTSAKEAALARDRVALHLGLPPRVMNFPEEAKRLGGLAPKKALELAEKMREQEPSTPKKRAIRAAERHMRPSMKERYQVTTGPRPRPVQQVDVHIQNWVKYTSASAPKALQTVQEYWGWKSSKRSEHALRSSMTLNYHRLRRFECELGPLRKLLTRVEQAAPVSVEELETKAFWTKSFKKPIGVRKFLQLAKGLGLAPKVDVRSIKKQLRVVPAS